MRFEVTRWFRWRNSKKAMSIWTFPTKMQSSGTRRQPARSSAVFMARPKRRSRPALSSSTTLFRRESSSPKTNTSAIKPASATFSTSVADAGLSCRDRHQRCWYRPITFPPGSRNRAVISGASPPIGCTISPPLATIFSMVASALSTMM